MLWFRHACGLSLLVGLFLYPGCAVNKTVPDQFVRQAEPGVTLTALTQHPEAHKGKVVIMGGVIVETKEQGGRLWLLMKNRPVDEDYMPHRDATMHSSESGHYWVTVDSQSLPKTYRKWARVTVVGRVSDAPPIRHEATTEPEPVLVGLYLRGWGYGDSVAEGWEANQDANYIQSNPLGELRQ
jgi:starvation-inducible outer membrane lipoprotein